MATVNQIREGIAANLASLTDAQISPYLLGNATPPTLMVMPGPPGGGDFTEYHKAMGQPGHAWMTFTVRTEVGIISDVAAQETLGQFLDVNGSSSVRAAIEQVDDATTGAVTLGGLVQNVIVTRSVAGLVSAQDGAQKIAAEWEVVVYT